MNHDDNRDARHGLTTEELAHLRDGSRDEDSAPAYPGDAAPVSDAPTGASSDTTDSATTADSDTMRGTAAESTGPPQGAASATDGSPTSPDATAAEEQPLMPESEAADFRDQWSRIQGDFVDDPKESVRAADALVAAVMQHLASTFASHKEELEKQWSGGGEAATEDLRLALQRYRSFFNRLLST
ncbi:hypothetical protein ABZZ20_33660 [Streptomyces sp. NPDC006430]|uniref:hypothetical protein n=1 Tax=Streptomyces sp. NPDC006430 TaxID=3154299 RepID=UPI0033A8DA62